MTVRFASLYSLPEDEMQFRVEEWPNGDRYRCICASSDLDGAIAAYHAIVARRPGVEITLRQGTRVMRTTERR